MKKLILISILGVFLGGCDSYIDTVKSLKHFTNVKMLNEKYIQFDIPDLGIRCIEHKKLNQMACWKVDENRY